MDQEDTDKEDPSPPRRGFLRADESATFSAVGLVVGVGSSYAQFLSQRINGWFFLIVVCAALTVMTVGVIVFVKRVQQVALPVAVAFAVVGALIGGGVGYVLWGRGDTANRADSAASSSTPATPSTVASSATASPTATSDPPAAGARMTFSRPAVDAAPVEPGTDVSLAGRVEGLPAADLLWLVSQPSGSGAAYYIVEGEPVARSSGEWDAVAKKLGDATDSGKARIFFGVDADNACSTALDRASKESPRKMSSLPPTCRRLEPSITVRFR